MKRIFAALVALLVACGQTTTAADQSLTAGPWAPHVITSAFLGADGVQIVGPNVVTAWEQSGAVTVAPLAGGAVASFTGMPGVEDAKASTTGIAVASDGGSRLYFIPPGGPPQVIASSLGHGRWMQVAWGDVDQDGLEDIVAIGRTAGAVAAWFKAPSWAYTKMGDVGWGMSLKLLDIDSDGDLDAFLTDRAKIGTSWALYGARWLEQIGPTTWTNHPISVAGSCPTCTPGDEMMASLADLNADGVLDLVHCQSSASKPNRVVVQLNTAGWGAPATWTTLVAPNPGFAHGHCQHVVAEDVDLNGLYDLLVSTWETNALPPSAASGVYVLLQGPVGVWVADDISGPIGSKYDNIEVFDVDGDGDKDIVTSEQVENLGVLWYENPL